MRAARRRPPASMKAVSTSADSPPSAAVRARAHHLVARFRRQEILDPPATQLRDRVAGHLPAGRVQVDETSAGLVQPRRDLQPVEEVDTSHTGQVGLLAVTARHSILIVRDTTDSG